MELTLGEGGTRRTVTELRLSFDAAPMLLQVRLAARQVRIYSALSPLLEDLAPHGLDIAFDCAVAIYDALEAVGA